MKRFVKICWLGLLMTSLMCLCACGSSDEKSSKKGNRKQKKQEKQEKQEKTEFKVGETWLVKGQWAITVNKVTETNERNEYADQKPAAVYTVDYTYQNIGYEDPSGMMDGLYVAFDNMIVDAEGSMGYEYPGDQATYPQETPVGATCKAQACIGVDHPGIFTAELSIYDSQAEEHKAKFIMDPKAKPAKTKESANQTDTSKALKLNETWKVPGQWELTVTGVKEEKERNEYADVHPKAVYIIDYTYKNLGYEDSSGMMDGLFFNLEDSIVDAKGTMGYSYPGDTEKYPEETPVGATCNAQVCIGVDHPGAFTINVLQYTGDGKKQTQSFYVDIK